MDYLNPHSDFSFLVQETLELLRNSKEYVDPLVVVVVNSTDALPPGGVSLGVLTADMIRTNGLDR